MQIQEKKLIKDLFKKLNLAEKNSSFKDLEAESFIKKKLEKQPNAIYYMIQTILVQEVAIKKLNNIIKQLESKLKNSSASISSKKSFLSDLINKYIPNESSEDKSFNSNSRINNSYYHKNDRPLNQPNENINTSMSGGNSSFLTNALQTAVGVTGGIVAGNMLLNLFDHNKPEDDILNHSNENFISNEEYDNQDDKTNDENSFEYPENDRHTSLGDTESFSDSEIYNDNHENTQDLNNTNTFIDTNETNQDNISDIEDSDINNQEYFHDEDLLDEDYDNE